jgi:hypothetical protein
MATAKLTSVCEHLLPETTRQRRSPFSKEEPMNSPPEPPQRLVALDVHRHYVVAIDHQQQIVLRPQRVPFEEFAGRIQVHLLPSDAVVLEATANAWQLYDPLQPWVASVTVAHPTRVTRLASAPVKTDAQDALTLARLLAAGLIPAVWVPPREVRELRALVSHRQRLIRQRTQARKRLPSLPQRHNLLPPGPEPVGSGYRAWWLAFSRPVSTSGYGTSSRRWMHWNHSSLRPTGSWSARASLSPGPTKPPSWCTCRVSGC